MAKNSTSFKKGTSGNPSGKPKGSKNRTTEEIRSFIQQVVSNNLDNLEADLQRMSPSNRWTIIEKVTKYFLPALNKNDNTNDNTGSIEIRVTYNNDDNTNG